MEYILSLKNIDRRVFIKGLGLVSLSLLMGSCGGCEELSNQIAHRPTRRRLRTGSADVDTDINTYKEAVRLMKALPAGDPRNWDKMAAIHGTFNGGFNFCQHGTDHFFSWHRIYLSSFEKICQKLTGNSNFGLPYWNWNQNPDINPAFLDTSSVLFLARNRNSVSGVSAVSTPALDPIFADSNFFTFSSQLEGTPHNTVHTQVGGRFGGSGSAMDPIFYTHHCMIDYSWVKWNIELGKNNTNDPGWNNTVWNHFVDADGNPMEMTAGISILLPLLSYQYESSAIGHSPAALSVIKTKSEFQKLEKRLREGANIKFDIKQRIPISEKETISILKPFSKETKVTPDNFARIVNNDMSKDKIFVSIKYASLPATSDFYVRVFINKPDANYATSTEDPHYAGSFAFFGTLNPDDNMEGHDHMSGHQPKFLVNIDNTLQNLKKNQEFKDGTSISVQLVAIPYEGKTEMPDTQLILDNIELIVTPVIIN